MIFVSNKPPHGLVFPYFLYTIGFYDAFKEFFASYYNSHKLVKLNESDDAAVLSAVRTAINVAFPDKANELEPNLVYRFFNACHRVFGRPPPGPKSPVFDEYPKPDIPTEDFFSRLEQCLVEISIPIVELGATEVKLGNYGDIVSSLTELQSMLVDNTYNEIEEVTIDINNAFTVLINLLRNDDLMVKRLSFRGNTDDGRMKEICRLTGKPFANNARQIYNLADKLDYFIEEQVKKKQWNQDEVKDLVEDPNNRQLMIDIINDYGIVIGKNLFEAANLRRKGTK